MKRTYQFAPDLMKASETLLQKRKVSLKDSASISQAVKKLSDYYIDSPLGITPWKETWTQIAYLGYYLHLNEIRNRAVREQINKLGFPLSRNNLLDFGSGLGSGSYNLLNDFKTIDFIERDLSAQRLHQELIEELGHPKVKYFKWHLNSSGVSGQDAKTIVCSYSLTELSAPPAWLFEAESLIVVEPSTLEDGKKLLQLRETLLSKGFNIWAPCTHQKHCPLLEGKKDWCHDRVHVDAPEWFKKVESGLPFRNQTVTFGYLLAHKTAVPKNEGLLRVVGDPLVEKGKTRQLVCRDDQRRFLAWLDRHHSKPQALDRGDLLIDSTATLELKQNEWRVPQATTLKSAE